MLDIVIGDDETPRTGEKGPAAMEAEGDGLPHCVKCIYFEITWDKARPRQCNLFGFRGPSMPSKEVFAATGQHCPAYRRRPAKQE